jgi:hypothetical protein
MGLLRSSPCWAIALLFLALNAHADDDLLGGEWHFQLGVPFWLSSITGDLETPNYNDIPVSASFSQIISHFTFGMMAHAEATNNQVGFGADLIYVNLSDALDTGRSLPALQTLNLGLKQVFAEGFMFYRGFEAGKPGNPNVFDLLGGFRYYWTESQLNQFESSVAWVDLMFGARGQIAIGDHVSLRPRADLALLGSKLTWNIIAEAAWIFSDHWTASAAYRVMDIDYEKASTSADWDLNYHGPLVGVTYTF